MRSEKDIGIAREKVKQHRNELPQNYDIMILKFYYYLRKLICPSLIQLDLVLYESLHEITEILIASTGKSPE